MSRKRVGPLLGAALPGSELELVGEPRETVLEPVAGVRVGALHELGSCELCLAEIEHVGDLGGVAREGAVLLVGEHEQRDVAVLDVGVCQHRLHLGLGLLEPLRVGAVHHKDDPVRLQKVLLPAVADLLLSAQVPDGHPHAVVLHNLHVEPERRFSVYLLALVQLVQCRRLACSVKAV